MNDWTGVGEIAEQSQQNVPRGAAREQSPQRSRSENPAARGIAGHGRYLRSWRYELTARTATGRQVGWLDAVTRRETVEVQQSDASRFSHPVDPLTNHFVDRGTRDFRDGQ